MNVEIIASTKLGVESKENFEILSGKAAGVCYMPSTFNELINEDVAKTNRRVNQTKQSGHHSVFDHNSITLYLQDVPKIVAMLLNNEKQYTTSEKSGRYTRLESSEKETMLYNKWFEIFKSKITKKYKEKYPDYFTDGKIEKLAQEEARYMTSVFTPTHLVYTTTYRQFNYLISFMEKQLSKSNVNDFEKKLNGYLSELLSKFKELPYYDSGLTQNEKDRSFSLFANGKKVEEYFGEVYSTSYKASFAELAQAQRHRTISYSFNILENEYYVPPIIADSVDFTQLWIDDLKSVGDAYPNATLLEVNEMGTLDAFILKMKERKCTHAQLEINRVTVETQKKYEYALRMKIHPRAEEMMNYSKGSRCTFPDFKCTAPCRFELGINETRDV